MKVISTTLDKLTVGNIPSGTVFSNCGKFFIKVDGSCMGVDLATGIEHRFMPEHSAISYPNAMVFLEDGKKK